MSLSQLKVLLHFQRDTLIEMDFLGIRAVNLSMLYLTLLHTTSRRVLPREIPKRPEIPEPGLQFLQGPLNCIVRQEIAGCLSEGLGIFWESSRNLLAFYEPGR